MHWRRCSRPRAFRVSLVVLAALALATVVPTQAGASGHHNYCGVALNPHTWCTSGQFHTYSSNIAHYHGSGNIRVCSKFRDRYGYEGFRVCAYDEAVSALGYQNSSLYIQALVANSSNYRHTIWGHGYYGGCCY